MEIVFVVAIAENGVIGAGNAMPWRLFLRSSKPPQNPGIFTYCPSLGIKHAWMARWFLPTAIGCRSKTKSAG